MGIHLFWYPEINRSSNKIINSKGNVIKHKVERSDKIEKFTENCHTPDLVQAFSKENSVLNQVLRHAKPPTYMTAFIVM